MGRRFIDMQEDGEEAKRRERHTDGHKENFDFPSRNIVMSSTIPAKESAELSTAVLDDTLYRLRDDAKKRAVLQKGTTYEDFEQMVKAAHLTPINDGKGINKKTSDNASSAAARNNMMPDFITDASGRRVRIEMDVNLQVGARGTDNDGCGKSIHQVPNDAVGFERQWRSFASPHHSNDKRLSLKYKYLLQLPPSIIADIFRIEIKSVMLADVLETLSVAYTANTSSSPSEEASHIVKLLDALSRSGRFALNVRLIGKKATQAVQSLLCTIQETIHTQSNTSIDMKTEVDRLFNLYNIKTSTL